LKEIVTRTLTGSIFIVTVVGSMMLHPLAFFVVMGVYAVIGLAEFFRLTIGKGSYFVTLIPGLLTYSVIGLIGLRYLPLKMALLLIPLVFLVMAMELFRKNGSWQKLSYYLVSLIYVALPFGLMNFFFYLQSDFNQMLPLLSLFVLVWTGDVFAYLSGTFFGKHKLFPRISPKKTWEGSIGGLLFALIAAYIFYLLAGHFSLEIWLSYAAILVVAATIGDLAESMLKRNSGVKDSGTLFPGHGGVLDRFDAVLFATPFALVFLNFVLK